jgi:hypothetical protein
LVPSEVIQAHKLSTEQKRVRGCHFWRFLLAYSVSTCISLLAHIDPRCVFLLAYGRSLQARAGASPAWVAVFLVRIRGTCLTLIAFRLRCRPISLSTAPLTDNLCTPNMLAVMNNTLSTSNVREKSSPTIQSLTVLLLTIPLQQSADKVMKPAELCRNTERLTRKQRKRLATALELFSQTVHRCHYESTSGNE